MAPVLGPSYSLVQSTTDSPCSDDNQLISGGCDAWHILWLSTNAKQLTVPMHDEAS